MIYERNPLGEVICQLRFPTILRIASEPPAAFQEQLRESYPIFRQEQAAPVLPEEVSRMIGELPVQFGVETAYSFETEDSARAVSLTREFLAIVERRYERWERMRDEIVRVKDAFEAVYSPGSYTRVGLRYQDTIDRDGLDLGEEPWHQLLNPPLAGMLGADEEVRDEVTGATAAAEIRVPDVTGGSVRLQYGLAEQAGNGAQVFGIDADFYTRERSSHADVVQILNSFNHHAGNLFRWAISDRVRDALRPRPVEPGDVGSE